MIPPLLPQICTPSPTWILTGLPIVDFSELLKVSVLVVVALIGSSKSERLLIVMMRNPWL